MNPKQRQQLFMALAISDAFFLFILASTGLWGLVILLVAIEMGVGLLIYLRRKGVWTPRPSSGRTGLWIAAAVAVVLLLLILLLTVGVSLYTDWLWFGEVGYTNVFTTRIITQVLLFIGSAVVVTLFLGGSMHLALHWLPRRDWPDEQAYLTLRWRTRAAPLVTWLVAAGVGLVFGASVQGRWMHVLRFLNGVTVGRTDPLFQQDLGFYLFRLDLLLDAKNALLWLTILALGLTALVYGLVLRRLPFPPLPLAHLSVLGTFFLLVMAWNYRLQALLLLYSRNGAAYGAGYTDVHARWPAYNILFWIVIGCAALLLVNLWRRTWKLLAAGAGLWLVSALVLGAIYPALVQSFRVRPSELDLERPYIQNNINATLAAYGLENVAEQDFPVTGTLTLDEALQNTGTTDNIRLWDHRPLKQTYSQLQAIRLYYNFSDIDVERYSLSGQYRQVELSVREISVDLLPDTAQTWVNRHLLYTHGYGIVLSPVSKTCDEGQPCFLLRNIPPETTEPALRLDRPEIYFGEESDNYIVINTTTDEFDYPKGDENQYTRYQGSGGIPMGSFFRRLAFAIRFGDLPLLVSEYITPESRILFRRTIQDRVETIAPFLWYDYDPYPVIVDGRIYWIQDAYTVSDMAPYSQPYEDTLGQLSQFEGYNYFRNSVKVVIDTYNGTTAFYVVDPTDPLVQTYARIFPGLFRSVEEMPAGLRAHWRYPENIFRIQSDIYATYHMRDPQVFYNKEDAWNFAKETYEGQVGPIDAYYVIMRLPGWEREEFFLMVPFTPASRDNMIAWMHVQCDGSDYGKLGVFKFPKQSLIYGPFQIQARINQDPIISSQLTLWNQRGSQVIRGNLLVIPLYQSLLYVEPLYLKAESGQIPELRRVTVVYGNRIAMAETLEGALRQVLVETPLPPTQEQGWQDLARSAQQHYQRAQECLKAGDWTCYGAELQALEQNLQDLVQLTGK